MAAIWEEFVQLGSSVGPRERAQTIAAFETLVAMADGEGIELLRRAKERNGGKRVPIVQHDSGSGIGLDDRQNPSLYFIALDFKHIGTTAFEDRLAAQPGMYRPMTVMGMLIHELYHVATDYTPLITATKTLLDKAQANKTWPELTPDLRATINAELENAQKDIRDNRFFSMLDFEPFAPSKYPNLAKFWKHLEKSDAPEITRAVFKKERDATQYTDALLQKNGCQEPWRESYFGNTKTIEAESIAANMCKNLSPTKGFAAENELDGGILGTLNAPQVRPHQPEKAPPVRFK